ncbi:MAG: ComF family protein [Gemmatimonadota bacterium]
MTFARWAEAVLDRLLPPLCLHCDAPLARARPALCDVCLGAITPLAGDGCRRCGLPRPGSPEECARCRDWPVVLTAVAATRHGGPAAAAVHALKYRGWRHLADACAPFMTTALATHGVEPDLLVPVPLHSSRQRARGFNQAELLAAALARRLGRPMALALARDRATARQVGSSRAARLANVRGAFRCLQRFDPRETIALVDDVATSGATLAAAAAALSAAGATRVVGVTFALALDPYDR